MQKTLTIKIVLRKTVVFVALMILSVLFIQEGVAQEATTTWAKLIQTSSDSNVIEATPFGLFLGENDTSAARKVVMMESNLVMTGE